MSEAATGYTGLESAATDIEQSTISTISYRLIPFLIVSFFFCVLDRVNISFAALTMNADLGFSPLVYAWGAGIFFIGYVILEIPSNLALHRFGARLWIARIMILWGLISASMAFITGIYGFLTVRFFLGVAEAGFFPGIILYLTYWFPAAYRARVMAAFILGSPLSAVLGGPLCSLLLEMNGIAGLKGWQWLFIAEGIPAAILGVFALFYLRDGPADAPWLTAAQKTWLDAQLAREQAAKQASSNLSLGEALRSPRVIMLGLVYFGILGSLYGVQFWLPQIVKGFGLSNLETGFVSAIPFLFGAAAMLFWSARSDRNRERAGYIVVGLLASALSLAATAYSGSLVLTMTALTVAAMAGFTAFGLFWTLPSALLTGAAAAGGLALINSIGSLAGFGGPYLIGWIKESTGSAVDGLLFLAGLPAIAAVLVFCVKHDSKSEFGDVGR